jgi:hypothetical protein
MKKIDIMMKESTRKIIKKINYQDRDQHLIIKIEKIVINMINIVEIVILNMKNIIKLKPMIIVMNVNMKAILNTLKKMIITEKVKNIKKEINKKINIRTRNMRIIKNIVMINIKMISIKIINIKMINIKIINIKMINIKMINIKMINIKIINIKMINIKMINIREILKILNMQRTIKNKIEMINIINNPMKNKIIKNNNIIIDIKVVVVMLLLLVKIRNINKIATIIIRQTQNNLKILRILKPKI